jgi:hypothetical protein
MEMQPIEVIFNFTIQETVELNIIFIDCYLL